MTGQASPPPAMDVADYATLEAMLKDTVETLGIEYYVEGISKETETAFTKDSALLRVTGPLYYSGSSQDIYKFEVLVLITDLQQTNGSGYDIHTRAGVIAQTLSNVIPVYRHGDEDPATLVGCLQKDRDSREFVRVVNYGIIEKDIEVKQMGVLAKYEICI
mgnify:CR=1 FL=1